MLDAATRGVWQMDALLGYIHQSGSDKLISECRPSYRPITACILFAAEVGYFGTVLVPYPCAYLPQIRLNPYLFSSSLPRLCPYAS
jgi:hypothetical protein